MLWPLGLCRLVCRWNKNLEVCHGVGSLAVGLGEVGYWLVRWSLVSATKLEALSSPGVEFESNPVIAVSEKLNYQDFHN